MTRETYLKIKRKFDVVLAGMGFTATLPLMAVASIAIVLDDPEAGPLYSQIRVGRNGRNFRMYKLRTMRKDADKELHELSHLNEADGPAFKIKDDPRVTRIGKFLRKSCIDELPQLWNVMQGSMSLVGPRPPLPKEVKKYEPWQMKRLSMTPGITCYWQIMQNRNDVPFNDWVRMDLKYVEDASLATDFSILLKTVGCVLKLSGR